MTSPGFGQRSGPDLVTRHMQLSDAIRVQTNDLIARIDADFNDRDAGEALADLGRELVEHGCGLLDYLGLDVSRLFNALDELIDYGRRRGDK